MFINLLFTRKSFSMLENSKHVNQKFAVGKFADDNQYAIKD